MKVLLINTFIGATSTGNLTYDIRITVGHLLQEIMGLEKRLENIFVLWMLMICAKKLGWNHCTM